MAASPELVREPEERVLVITRVLDAPRVLVFKVWTQPEHLVRWWGPSGFTLPDCKVELQEGGAFRCHMRSPEGTNHHMHGVYREIVAPERLSFTWAWIDEAGQRGHETLVTVLLEEAGAQGEKTRLTLHHAVFESESARDAHNGGWTECFERLAAYVAGL